MATTIDAKDRRIKMGLGDAVLRLVHVELKHANGLSVVPGALKQERDMIKESLNQYLLDMGVSCDSDAGDVPDTVALFQRTAETSCCRIQFGKSSRKSTTTTTAVVTNVVEDVVTIEPLIAAVEIPAEVPITTTPTLALPRGSSRRAK